MDPGYGAAMQRQTRVVHAGVIPDGYGSVTEPVYRSSTFSFESVDESLSRSAAVYAGEPGRFVHGRLGNPTNAALERRLADLEGAQDCLVTASGMGAIATVMWTLLRQGDHLLADTAVYGDTRALLEERLASFGVRTDFVDFSDLAAVQRALRPETALVYFESPCSPTLKCNDIAAVSTLAHQHNSGIRVVVDNTLATPYLQNPLALGADLVVHSLSKFVGGHSDVVAGCICGSTEDISRLRFTGVGLATGAVLSPDNAFLVLRGIASLAVRMDRHCDNALAVARHLERSPFISRVHYPGLESHPGYEIALRQMRGFGGVVAAELNLPFEQVKEFVGSLTLARLALGLGGVESLVEHPASMTHATDTPEELREAGIPLSLVSIGVGIEDVHDIIDDLEQGLRTVQLADVQPFIVGA